MPQFKHKVYVQDKVEGESIADYLNILEADGARVLTWRALREDNLWLVIVELGEMVRKPAAPARQNQRRNYQHSAT